MSTLLPGLAGRLAQTLGLGLAVALLASTALAAPTGFAARSSLTAAASAATGSTNIYSETAFDATNAERRDRGRGALRGDACLERAALRQAKAMAGRNRLSHQDLGRIQRDCGMGFVGENVAYGYSSGGALVRQGWMRSDGHRANILGRDYRLMGLAAVKRDGRWWAAQVFGTRR